MLGDCFWISTKEIGAVKNGESVGCEE